VDRRRAFVAVAAKAPREVRTFCGTLHATGCRISEALALTARQIDLSGRVVVFESLKKRRRGVFRACRCRPSCWTPSTWCTASGKRSGWCLSSKSSRPEPACGFCCKFVRPD
jgi:hypothetical protein